MNIQAEIDKINDALQPHLPEGAVVVAEIAKSKWGTSGGSFKPVGEGENEALWEILSQDEVDKIGDPISDIFRFAIKEKGLKRAVGLFRFAKGGAPSFSIPVDQELVAETRQMLKEELTAYKATDTGVQLDIRFVQDEDGVEAETIVLKQQAGTWSEGWSSVPQEAYICLRETNGGDIDRMVVFLEGDTFWIASNPPKPALGFKDISEVTLAQDVALQQRLEAIETARSMREAFYKTLGEYHAVNYEPYIESALRGGHEWPTKQARFQLIYTPVSTVVISSGLSDVFREKRPDPTMKYNGYAIEFYLEFQGRIPWADLENHHCLEWLNTITQVAIGHGEVKGLLEKYGSVSVQLSSEGLPKTHLAKGKKATALLGVPSPNLPETMPMNIEETRLASITMLTVDEGKAVEAGDETDKAAARKTILEAHVKNGSHCYNPFDRNQQKPRNGMVEVPLLPIR
ncbi:MAG: hypothetical protein U0176_01235 [Bacteroidia bacterium]